MNYLIILVVLTIALIMWQVHSAKKAKANRLTDEKKQKEFHEIEERKELREEKRIFEQIEARKHQKVLEETGNQTRIGRDIREAELRRQIKDRKDREAEENTQKGEK